MLFSQYTSTWINGTNKQYFNILCAFSILDCNLIVNGHIHVHLVLFWQNIVFLIILSPERESLVCGLAFEHLSKFNFTKGLEDTYHRNFTILWLFPHNNIFPLTNKSQTWLMLALLNQGGKKLNRIWTTESQVKGSNELKLILNIFFKSYNILNENISNLT